MRKEIVVRGPAGRIVLMDTITSVGAEDTGAIVVAASHGGVSSGEFALEHPLMAAFFNDAGVGKDGAGIAALAMLQARDVAAGAVSHQSCRIGDVDDMWRHGVISHTNPSANTLGLAPGMSLREALTRVVGA